MSSDRFAPVAGSDPARPVVPVGERFTHFAGSPRMAPTDIARDRSDRDDPAAAGGEPPAFDAALAELESIVEQMESGALSLEASLDAYRRGAALVTRCRGMLATVQDQVRVLEADLLKPLADVGAPDDEA